MSNDTATQYPITGATKTDLTAIDWDAPDTTTPGHGDDIPAEDIPAEDITRVEDDAAERASIDAENRAELAADQADILDSIRRMCELAASPEGERTEAIRMFARNVLRRLDGES